MSVVPAILVRVASDLFRQHRVTGTVDDRLWFDIRCRRMARDKQAHLFGLPSVHMSAGHRDDYLRKPLQRISELLLHCCEQATLCLYGDVLDVPPVCGSLLKRCRQLLRLKVDYFAQGFSRQGCVGQRLLLGKRCFYGLRVQLNKSFETDKGFVEAGKGGIQIGDVRGR